MPVTLVVDQLTLIVECLFTVVADDGLFFLFSFTSHDDDVLGKYQGLLLHVCCVCTATTAVIC